MFNIVKTGLSAFSRFSRCTACREYGTTHPFINKKLSSQELAEELVGGAIHYPSGFIVLNKPQGISFAENEPLFDKNNFEVSLHSLRPILKSKLNCKELLNVRVPEKYASGVAVFCTDVSLMDRVKKRFRSMRACGYSSEVYDCIVLGQPNVPRGFFEGGITLESSPNGKQKGIRLIKECAKSNVRKGIVKPVRIEHETLAVCEFASRVAISTSRTKWHAIRVYASTKLVSPILGDRVFGGLVRTILGTPVSVDMFSPAASHPQKIPKELLSKLNLIGREDIEIPLHLHLSKVNLWNFPSKGKHLEFYVEPPDYYKWTCSNLDLDKEKLNLPERKVNNCI